MRKIFLLFLVCLTALLPVKAYADGYQNPVMFIGQAVLGATAGAPLSVDASGLLTSGISTTKVTSSSDTTTTSTASPATAVINTMTITPAAGTYNVDFATTLSSNANNVDIFVSIWAGNALSAGTEQYATPQIQGGLTPSLPFDLVASTIGQVTVNGSQAIEIRWRLSGAGKATSHHRTMIITRIQ